MGLKSRWNSDSSWCRGQGITVHGLVTLWPPASPSAPSVVTGVGLAAELRRWGARLSGGRFPGATPAQPLSGAHVGACPGPLSPGPARAPAPLATTPSSRRCTGGPSAVPSPQVSGEEGSSGPGCLLGVTAGFETVSPSFTMPPALCVQPPPTPTLRASLPGPARPLALRAGGVPTSLTAHRACFWDPGPVRSNPDPWPSRLCVQQASGARLGLRVSAQGSRGCSPVTTSQSCRPSPGRLRRVPARLRGRAGCQLGAGAAGCAPDAIFMETQYPEVVHAGLFPCRPRRRW